MPTKTYNQSIHGTVHKVLWTKCDWGFTAVFADELEALRVAYAHRNSKHGVQIKIVVDGFMVTLFDENTPAGIDRN